VKPGVSPENENGNGHKKYRHHTVLPRFRDAFSGIYQAYREEPNLRFHVFAASCATLAGSAVGLEPWEVAYLSLTVLVVLFAEMVNTAVERAVDFAAAGRRHSLAGQAKEVAAGGVAVAALHALFAAGYLFLYQHSLLETLSDVWHLVVTRPWWLALPLAAGALGLVGGEKGAD
jgi:diacylglycerol kinase